VLFRSNKNNCNQLKFDAFLDLVELRAYRHQFRKIRQRGIKDNGHRGIIYQNLLECKRRLVSRIRKPRNQLEQTVLDYALEY
jgi:hypothetical protein